MPVMNLSILQKTTPEAIEPDPFPHLHIENALPQELYDDLASSYPAMEKIVGARPLENNKAYLSNAVDILPDQEIPQVWRDFFSYHTSDAWFREALAFWQEPLARIYPDIEQRFGKSLQDLATGLRQKAGRKTRGNQDAEIMLDVQFGINSPVTEVSTVRGPHVDKPEKLFAALLYFRRPDDPSTGGDLGLYRCTKRTDAFDGQYNIGDAHVERVKSVPYKPNSLVMWINSKQSLHGVSPRSVTDVPRRYVNFIAETYSLGKPGLFRVDRPIWSRSLSGARRMLGFRDV